MNDSIRLNRLLANILAVVLTAGGTALLMPYPARAQNPLPCDLNSDNEVNVQDLGVLLSAWGGSAQPFGACGNGGTVEVTELGVLLSNWGKTGGGGNTVASLPVPADGVFELTFDHPIGHAVTGDFNDDKILDFAIRSDHYAPQSIGEDNIWIEARLNNGKKLWEFNTEAGFNNPSNGHDLPMTSWDFNGDGRWEVYFQYQRNGRWWHRIVDGMTGEPLADDEFPVNWGDTKSMVAVAYRGGVPRLVTNLDFWEGGDFLWMFETWNGSSWNLDPMWHYGQSGSGVAHDMFRTADVDQNGSDDEIIAGCVALNANGGVRYHVGDLIGGECGNSDMTYLGYYSSEQPQDLIHLTGDGNGKHVAAVWAKNGQRLWAYDMSQLFPDWTHWHTGRAADRDPDIPGAEVYAVDRNTSAGARFKVEDGTILEQGMGYEGGCKPIQWNDNAQWDTTYECYGGANNDLDGVGDIGGPGCEEVWGRNGSETLAITFNLACPSTVPSRWANRHYRQDVALFASGYAPYYINPLVILSSGE